MDGIDGGVGKEGWKARASERTRHDYDIHLLTLPSHSHFYSHSSFSLPISFVNSYTYINRSVLRSPVSLPTHPPTQQLTKIASREPTWNSTRPHLALRLAVESGGCHGYQYEMKLEEVPQSGEGASGDERGGVNVDD